MVRDGAVLGGVGGRCTAAMGVAWSRARDCRLELGGVGRLGIKRARPLLAHVQQNSTCVLLVLLLDSHRLLDASTLSTMIAASLLLDRCLVRVVVLQEGLIGRQHGRLACLGHVSHGSPQGSAQVLLRATAMRDFNQTLLHFSSRVIGAFLRVRVRILQVFEAIRPGCCVLALRVLLDRGCFVRLSLVRRVVSIARGGLRLVPRGEALVE